MTGSTSTLPAPAVILASASPGRLSVLRAAGIEPQVLVSGVDEDAVTARYPDADPPALLAALATAKAEAVAREHHLADAIVIGADSMLLLDGHLQGKPHTRDEALRRWTAQAGRTGELLTGQVVLRIGNGAVQRRAGGTASTGVRFGRPDIGEVTAYVDTGEPLEVAGAFTIDGFGGWFIDRIDGDPSCVVGLSLPLLRRLLADIGVRVTDLWRRPETPQPPADPS